jgi:hypothetical protein
MRGIGRACALIAVGTVCISAQAETTKCTQAAASAAETQPRPQTWARLYVTFGRYGQCDDGGVAEAWSDFVATLLAEHWEVLPDLHALTAAHPSFKKFVLRHLDETINQDQAEAIAHNARENCPANTRKLCDQILRRVSTI